MAACRVTRSAPRRRAPCRKDFAHFKSSTEAWARRIASGQAHEQHDQRDEPPRHRAGAGAIGDWTDRIAAGELPFAQPSRPQGVERNVVLTLWDWSRPTAYMHDLIGTDRRNPTLNANGKFYGAPRTARTMWPVLDPVRHTATEVKHPVRDPKTPSHRTDPMAPSPYWGAEPIWDSQTQHAQPDDGREGAGVGHRARSSSRQPRFLQEGLGAIPRREYSRSKRASRHLSMYDPAANKWTLISTCFPTHHLIFAEDANNTLWTSSGGGGMGVIGWLNRKMFEETGDEVRSQGWTPFILDANGNGKRDEWVEPEPAGRPQRRTSGSRSNMLQRGRQSQGRLGLGHVAGAVPELRRARCPGSRTRPRPRSRRSTSRRSPATGARGGDIDSNGVFWASYASGHLGSFDRRKCKGPLNGPTRQRASTAPKAGRCTACPDRSSGT